MIMGVRSSEFHDEGKEGVESRAFGFPLMMQTFSEELRLLGCYAVWLFQDPHGVTSQKT
jgi:hypothetical protein